MAGRGRGRGSALTFDIGALGISRGEVIESVVEPPPLYPPLKVKPLPPIDSEECRYMAYLREKMVKWNREHCYIGVPEKYATEKYSDKYKPKRTSRFYECDKSYFPAELFHDSVRKKVKTSMKKKTYKPVDEAKNQAKGTEGLKILETGDIEKKVVTEEPEKASESSGDEKSENSENEADDLVDSEGEVEETDYIESYFDNGENYIDEDENLDDE